MSKGTVVQVIGAVIDVEFSKEELPKIYDALVVKEADLILEVQQQLGDGVVRTIAMGITEGLKRGAEAENTGEPVTCLLYTSPNPRDLSTSRMPSSA